MQPRILHRHHSRHARKLLDTKCALALPAIFADQIGFWGIVCVAPVGIARMAAHRQDISDIQRYQSGITRQPPPGPPSIWSCSRASFIAAIDCQVFEAKSKIHASRLPGQWS